VIMHHFSLFSTFGRILSTASVKSVAYIYLACLVFFVSTCSKEQKDVPARINNFSPNEVEAKGLAVPQKNVAQPKVIDDLSTRVPVGKPSIVILPVTSIVVPENLPVFQIDTTNLKEITPGVGGIPMPELVMALDSPFLAGTPTVVQAKDMKFRDQSQAKFSFFGKLHGLSSANIFNMLQDKLGNLWLATWNGGVTKYDGKHFTHFTTKQGLPDNKVQAILEDTKGNLWFGTYGGGIVKYDGKYFTIYSKRQGLCGNIVYALLEDSGGHIWIGTEDGGVSKYDGKTFTNFSNKKSLIGSGSRSIYEDSHGNIWFGTFGQGVLKYDGKTFVQYTIEDGWGNGMVHCMLPDKSGNIWFGTNTGAVKYDGKYFTKYTSKTGLTDNMVSSIVEDTFGNIWFGSLDDGLFKYNGNRIEAIENGKANNTMPVHDL
jgi:ligand-binding sensor domain-containing protein